MTHVEEIDHQIELLQRQRREALARGGEERARRVIRRLSGDESLPAREVLVKTQVGWRAEQERTLGDDAVALDAADSFIDRLDKVIDCHVRTRPCRR